MADRDSFEKPDLFVSCQASKRPIAGNSFTEAAVNNRPWRSFSTRALFVAVF